jgi:excisionase family DNA binding protein
MMTSEFLTTQEAATELTVSQSTIRRLIRSGRLVAISITGAGGCVRLTRDSVEIYKAQLVNEARKLMGHPPTEGP